MNIISYPIINGEKTKLLLCVNLSSWKTKTRENPKEV